MHRLDRRLALKPAEPVEIARRLQQTVGLGDHRSVPQRHVLLVQRHVAALGAPGRAARLAVEHQGEESHRLGLPRHQRDHRAAKPDRLAGQRPAILPAGGEARVDRLQHGVESLGQHIAVGHREAQAGVPDPRLGPHQALAHGGGLLEEGGGDARGVKAEHGLQHQRGLRRGIDRRVGADEHQFQPLVAEALGFAFQHGKRLLDLRRHVGLGCRFHAAAALRLAQRAARRGEKPGLGRSRHTRHRPVLQRGAKGLAQRILGRCDVARASSKEGDQSAIAPAGRLFRGTGCRVLRHQPCCIGRTGRTSTTEYSAAGHLAAQSSAVSRSGTSMTKMPPSCSLASE